MPDTKINPNIISVHKAISFLKENGVDITKPTLYKWVNNNPDIGFKQNNKYFVDKEKLLEFISSDDEYTMSIQHYTNLMLTKIEKSLELLMNEIDAIKDMAIKNNLI